MPLLTYSQTRPWAKAIKSAVATRQMPPWSADLRFGKFSNDPTLSPAEIAILTAWATSGAPEGNVNDAPPPRHFAGGWTIPTPDAVFEMPEPYAVPAAGAIDYQNFVVPTGFTEDKWVESIEVRPGNRSVVHHAIVYIQGDRGWTNTEYLGGYSPGSVPQLWKPGQARLIPAGSKLLFQIHYTTNGTPGSDKTRMGVRFSKSPPTSRIVATQAINAGLAIPAGDPAYTVEAYRPLPPGVELVGMRAHMHLRGKSFEFRAVYPDGRAETLLRIPKFDFNWQLYYYLETPLKLPTGARIECTAVFDNSPNNPSNPDPKVVVRYGPQSWDEMMIGWLDVAIPIVSASPGN